MTEPAVITSLQAENFKRLKAIRIEPAQGAALVPLVGRNGQGKSSILDAIMAAIGGKKNMPDVPVRKGEDDGAIEIELSNGLTVRRIFEPDGGGSIVVSNSEGMRAPSPQAVLDKLYSGIAFDPFAFTTMDPEDQLKRLRSLVKLEVDVDALKKANDADYEARRDTNREIKHWLGQLTALQHLPDDEKPVPDIAALEQKIADAGLIEQRRARRATVQEERAQLLLRIEDLKSSLASAEDKLRSIDEALAAAEPLPDPVDIAAVQAEVAAARAVQAENEKIASKRALQATITKLEETSAGMTTAMETRDLAIAAAFEGAKMPVDGLSFGDGMVLFNGVPLAQASQAEKIRISIAIAVATSPELKVALVRDASLLDAEGYELLASLAAEHGFQAWVENVDTTGRTGVVIEDGEVKDAEPPEPIERPKRRGKGGKSAGDGAQDAKTTSEATNQPESLIDATDPVSGPTGACDEIVDDGAAAAPGEPSPEVAVDEGAAAGSVAPEDTAPSESAGSPVGAEAEGGGAAAEEVPSEAAAPTDDKKGSLFERMSAIAKGTGKPSVLDKPEANEEGKKDPAAEAEQRAADEHKAAEQERADQEKKRAEAIAQGADPETGEVPKFLQKDQPAPPAESMFD